LTNSAGLLKKATVLTKRPKSQEALLDFLPSTGLPASQVDGCVGNRAGLVGGRSALTNANLRQKHP
jgi:hypothetical protein